MNTVLEHINKRLGELDAEEKLAIKDGDLDKVITVVTIKIELMDLRKVCADELLTLISA